MSEKLKMGVTYNLKCTAPDGSTQVRTVQNLIPNEGLDYILEAAILSGTQHAEFFLGLIDGVIVPAAGTTIGNASTVEFTNYLEGARPLWDAVKTGTVVENSVTAAQYTVNADVDVLGVFISSDSAYGANGTLLSIANLDEPLSIVNGSVLSVTASFAFTSSV